MWTRIQIKLKGKMNNILEKYQLQGYNGNAGIVYALEKYLPYFKRLSLLYVLYQELYVEKKTTYASIALQNRKTAFFNYTFLHNHVIYNDVSP
jgi:hypothetical protein